jgi:hypothetical protein
VASRLFQNSGRTLETSFEALRHPRKASTFRNDRNNARRSPSGKGSSTALKRGTVIRTIHLSDDEDEIEGRTDKVKGLVLRTEFLKKP